MHTKLKIFSTQQKSEYKNMIADLYINKSFSFKSWTEYRLGKIMFLFNHFMKNRLKIICLNLIVEVLIHNLLLHLISILPAIWYYAWQPNTS